MNRMCNNFMAGGCRFGDSCMYRHGANDTRDLRALAKNRLCMNFQRGQCNYGDNCMYSHAGTTGVAGRGGGVGGNQRGGRGGSNAREGRAGGILGDASKGPITVVPHNLASEGLRVFIENRVRARMEHQKIEIFKDLLERGTKGGSWRGFDDKLDEIVAFGGTGLRNMIMAITGKSQDKADTLYVFFFEPNIGKQETEIKNLRASKHKKGAGGLFEEVFKKLKGTTDVTRIVIKKSKEEIKEDEEKKAEDAKKAQEAATTFEALDKQIAELALHGKGDNDNDEDRDFDLDAFI